jgi:hypothetical protein
MARPAAMTVITVLLALLAAACESGGGPNAAAAHSSPSLAAGVVCQDLAALRASVRELSSVELNAGTPGAVTADLSQIKAELATLADDVHGQWDRQVNALTSALAELQVQVKKLASHPGSEDLAAVRTAVSYVTVAARQLFSALTTRCPSSATAGS